MGEKEEKMKNKVDELYKDNIPVNYNLMQNYESGIWQKYVSYIKNMWMTSSGVTSLRP